MSTAAFVFILASDKAWERFKENRWRSGLSWNQFIKRLHERYFAPRYCAPQRACWWGDRLQHAVWPPKGIREARIIASHAIWSRTPT